MQMVLDAIRSFWDLIVYIISSIGINDILDIFVITFIFYKCIGFFRKTRGGQLVKGLVVLLIVALIAQWLDMVMVNWLMVRVMESILIAAVIIFQPEIRRALEHVGTSRFGKLGISGNNDTDEDIYISRIDQACKAAGSMQEQKCGALMVFERNTQLGEIISTGTTVDAETTAPLVCNIFYPKSPLHDGAMIMRDGKIHAAGCILPLTQNSELSKALGTRHRAAIGMSENSDAVVVVVSEETGTISIAVNGELKRGFDAITLHNELTELLIDEKAKTNNNFIARVISFFKPAKNENKEDNKEDNN